MTEWTSISVTEEQKAILEDHKPEEKAMGRFLVSVVEGDTDGTKPTVTVADDFEWSDEDIAEIKRKLDQIDGALGDTVEKALEIGDSREPVQLDATEYSKIADEIEGRLR